MHADLEHYYQQLHARRNELRAQSARYSGDAPVSLRNQLDDYDLAIELTQQLLTGQLSGTEWRKQLAILAVTPPPEALGPAQAIYKNWFDRVLSGAAMISPEQQAYNRTNMLSLVEYTWIEGVLNRSVYEAAMIELGLREDHAAVRRPWNVQLHIQGQSECLLPSDTRLIDLFDQTGGAFLMLGGPGAGKTTMLLDLCRDLISRARHNSAHPIPIVFNLSTWRGEALADWLVKELKHQYNVSPTIAQTWVAHKNLCLLLDGLDEVAPHRRTICVEAINTFRQDLLPIVVCGRSEAYQALSTKLSLATAVVIQPLTDHQIEAYLTQPAFNLEAVRGTLRADPDLRALIDTPFMLSIITLAYRGKSLDDLEALKTFSDRRARIFDIYLQQALSRRPGVTYAPSQTLGYLAWLAAQSNVRNQTIFHLEDIRCDWLPGKPQQMIYRLSIGLLYGCGFWLIGGPLLATMGGPVFGAIGGMAFGLLGGIAFGQQVDKEPAEKLTLSRSRFLKFGLFFGLAFGSVFGGVAGLLGGFETGLFLGIIFGAFFGMTFGLGGGLKPNPQITAHTRVGQGITQSLGNGLTFGLEMGLISGFLFFAMAGLPVGLLIGAGVGLVIGLLNGGHFVIQALFIYFLLAQAGIIPLRLISFLNDATDKIILQRVGPGYQFIHRLLQDHLAARYEADSTTAASTKNA